MNMLEKFKGQLDLFTGKEIERNIEEFTEKYGEILIGMHHRIITFEKQLDNIKEQVEKTTAFKEQIEALKFAEQSLKDRLDETNRVLKKLIEDVEHQKETNKTWAETYETLRENLTRVENHYKELYDQYSAILSDIEHFFTTIRHLEQQLHAFQSSTKERYNRYDEKLDELHTRDSEIADQLNQEIVERQTKFEQIDKQLEESREQFQNIQKEIVALTKKQRQLFWLVIGFATALLIWEIASTMM